MTVWQILFSVFLIESTYAIYILWGKNHVLVHLYDGLQTPQRTYELLKNSDCVSGRKAK